MRTKSKQHFNCKVHNQITNCSKGHTHTHIFPYTWSVIFNDKVLHNLMSLPLVMGQKRTLAGWPMPMHVCWL